MVSVKSLDPYIQIITSLLCDVQKSHSGVFTLRALRLTIEKIEERCAAEGIGLLTKTLPRLGKLFDRTLTGDIPMDAAKYGFDPLPNSKLPRFLGELFQQVFSSDGKLLQAPCVSSIKFIRQVLFLFYKLELPYDSYCERLVIERFIETDKSLIAINEKLTRLSQLLDQGLLKDAEREFPTLWKTALRARKLVSRALCNVSYLDAHPKHGPGAVSTKERLHEKYTFSVVSPRIAESFPIDAFYFASLGHVCDKLSDFHQIRYDERSARVLLVPKDSRGPRLISCEPLEFQWIQQGVKGLIVEALESNPLTKFSIHFTDQLPNQLGALLGSKAGLYSTLDLKDASDRVSVGLVHLLFEEPHRSVLLNCRSLSTELPSGEIMNLNKYAPMGSALCFPVMALSIWALLAAGFPCAGMCSDDSVCDFRRKLPCERFLVYGDDVVVPTAQAENAINTLESFGLAINRDKSCTSGFFRESCGVDAYKGESVTPVRIRTVWSSRRCPDAYVSYIAYANEMYERGLFNSYEAICKMLFDLYGQIPEVSMNISAPSLKYVPEEHLPGRGRVNFKLQKLEWYVLDVQAPKVHHTMDGWKMLLRYFAEASSRHHEWFPRTVKAVGTACGGHFENVHFSVSTYTKRRANKLVRRWR